MLGDLELLWFFVNYSDYCIFTVLENLVLVSTHFFAEHGSRSDIEKNHLSPLDDHHGHSFVCGLLIPTTKFSITFASEFILQTLILSHSWSRLVNAIRTPFYSRLFSFLLLFLVIGKWGANRKSSQAIKKSDYEEGQERVVSGYLQLEMQPM